MKTNTLAMLATVAVIGLGAAGYVYAQNNAEMNNDAAVTTTTTATTNDMTNTDTTGTGAETAVPGMSDGSPIVLTGTVGAIRADEFDLMYGANNKVTVELDRFGWSPEATEYLTQGESVTISGYIDDDLFEGREIEAYNVRLNDNYVYYYTADAIPVYTYEYDANRTNRSSSMNSNASMNSNNAATANTNTETNTMASTSIEDGSYLNMTGTVSEISGQEFKVTNSSGTMQVDASQLGYDAFDDEGMQQIKNGDRVYVYGSLDKGFFENNEIVAMGVVELIDSSRSN